MASRFNHILRLLCLIFLITSCHPAEKSPQNTLRLNLRDDPDSFDPRLVRSLRDLTLMKQLYEGLTRVDANGVAQPAVAEQITLLEDLCTYTFVLRPTYWNNGEQVTAYDFVRSWTEALDPNFASAYAYMLYPVKGHFEALDERTLEVTLEAPLPYFLELLAFPTYFPVHELAHVTNGPFQLKAWRQQEELALEKSMTYWDAERVLLDGLTFAMIDENHTESLLFSKNELDWLGQPISHNIVPEQLVHAAGVSSYDVSGTCWLRFNTLKPPFDKVAVRRAFSLAINREEIIEHVLMGSQKPATGPVPPSMAIAHEPYFFDNAITEARALLAPYSLEPIIFHFNPTERTRKIAQLIAEQWREALGVKVELCAVENQVYRKKIRMGDYQVGTGEWVADFNDPLAFLELFKEADGLNATGWEDERYRELLDRSFTERNLEKRSALLAEAEALLVDAMPIAPLYHYSFDYIKRPNVEGVLLSPLGTADFKRARIE